jgi:hypothetical protein
MVGISVVTILALAVIAFYVRFLVALLKEYKAISNVHPIPTRRDATTGCACGMRTNLGVKCSLDALSDTHTTFDTTN